MAPNVGPGVQNVPVKLDFGSVNLVQGKTCDEAVKTGELLNSVSDTTNHSVGFLWPLEPEG